MIRHQRPIGRILAVTTLAVAAACGGDAANDGTMGDTLASPTIGAGADTMGAGGAMAGMDEQAIVANLGG